MATQIAADASERGSPRDILKKPEGDINLAGERVGSMTELLS
jgi:hypothetical protein